ncbi:hypothetical protein SB783_24390 [Paraburkholderia sp. SIMBA_009]
MKVLVMIWLLAATFTVLGIAIDMRRLRAHRVWLPLRGWVVACACAGTFSALPYLFMRQRVRRKLIAAAWVLIGGQTTTKSGSSFATAGCNSRRRASSASCSA